MGRRRIQASPSPLGEDLRQKRIERGLTLENVHETTGLSTSYLSRLERGLVRKPAPDVLESLVNAGLVSGDLRQEIMSLGIQTLSAGDRETIRQIVREELERLQVGPVKSETAEQSHPSVQPTWEDNIIRIPKSEIILNLKERMKFLFNRIEFIEDPNPRRRA